MCQLVGNKATVAHPAGATLPSGFDPIPFVLPAATALHCRRHSAVLSIHTATLCTYLYCIVKSISSHGVSVIMYVLVFVCDLVRFLSVLYIYFFYTSDNVCGKCHQLCDVQLTRGNIYFHITELLRSMVNDSLGRGQPFW